MDYIFVDEVENLCVCVLPVTFFSSLFVKCLHWMRACRVVLTGRCHCGSCVSWGSAAWPASSPGQLNDSASYNGQFLLVFAVEARMGNSLLSPLYERKNGKMDQIFSNHYLFAGSVAFLFPVHKKGGLPSTSEVPPGPIDASTGTASLVSCVTRNEILWRQLRSHVTH